MIEVKGLTKYYGELRGDSRPRTSRSSAARSSAFSGLNGAGKTTALKILGCVLLPTAGDVTVDGIDIARDPHEVRRRIGFLPDTPPLYNEMTVGRYLKFAAELRGVPSSEADKAVTEAEEKTATREVHDQPIFSLSHGYRQRVGVAQALVHKPKLLILDEPTSGLDPVQIVEMREDHPRAARRAHGPALQPHPLRDQPDLRPPAGHPARRDRRAGIGAGPGRQAGRRRHHRGGGRGAGGARDRGRPHRHRHRRVQRDARERAGSRCCRCRARPSCGPRSSARWSRTASTCCASIAARRAWSRSSSS